MHIGRRGIESRGGVRRWTVRLLLWAVVAGLLLAFSRRAEAYPWMLKHGYQACDTCHVDPSGTGLLTPYGRVQGYILLAMPYGKQRQDAPSGPLWGLVNTPDWLMLGGAVQLAGYYRVGRTHNTAFYPMQTDLYGGFDTGKFLGSGSIGMAKVPVGLTEARKAQVTEGQGNQFNLVSRTYWLGWRPVGGLVIRAGRINVPIGIRMPEHNLWVRTATRTDHESDQQHGVAVAYTGGRLRGEVMGILGNYQLHPDRFRERGYGAFLEWLVVDKVGVGVNSRLTFAEADPISFAAHDTTLQAHGIFTRVAFDRFVYLQAEFDGLFRSRHRPGYVGVLQLNVEPIQGLHFIATEEILDDGKDRGFRILSRPSYGKAALGTWFSVDYYFLPQMSVRVDLFERQYDHPILLTQLHMYL